MSQPAALWRFAERHDLHESATLFLCLEGECYASVRSRHRSLCQPRHPCEVRQPTGNEAGSLSISTLGCPGSAGNSAAASASRIGQAGPRGLAGGEDDAKPGSRHRQRGFPPRRAPRSVYSCCSSFEDPTKVKKG